MSLLTLVRGRDNVYDVPVHLPWPVVAWNLTSIDFRIRPLGSVDTPNEAGDLLDRSTRVPPGGVSYPIDGRVRVTLTAEDIRALPDSPDGFDWSLEFRAGTGNVFVLAFGRLALSADGPEMEAPPMPEAEHPVGA
ncbi:MAG TPA: hypothetical protein VFN57_19270 [Thermomicrobiaceae bacterium]|nr:hypothetical protein [Thermomicrobiaceae bacterium]